VTNARTTRERAAAMRQQEQAKAKRRKQLVVIGTVAGIVVVILAILVPVLLTGGEKKGPVPAGVSGASGPIVVSKGPVTLDLYEDFQCPGCGELQKNSGSTIDELEKTGKVTANYYMLSFLGDESKRAANAAGCAQDQGKFKPFYDYLYAHQPPEKTGGYTTQELIAAGQAVGITTPVFDQCVTSMKYQGWVNNVDAAGREKITSTPTLFVNGKQVENPTPENLKNAVNAAG
jgi:protein-disulfide isomerase